METNGPTGYEKRTAVKCATPSAWAGGTEDIYQIFQFYPFGVPIVPTVLGVGGTELPHVW